MSDFSAALKRLEEAMADRQPGIPATKRQVGLSDLRELYRDWSRLDSIVREQHSELDALRRERRARGVPK